ncbi:MAG: hypothetical protein Q6373_008370 [Candidatus Sigynarchaeota archaeon]
MKLQYKIALFSIAFHVISLIIDFDTILLVLAILFTAFAAISLLPSKSQALNLLWLVSSLLAIAYAIYFAYDTIPNTAFNWVNILVSALKIVGGLSGVIAVTFGLELKHEESLDTAPA